MIRRQAQMARPVLHDRDRKPLGEVGEGCHRGAVAAGAGGDDQRVLGRGQNARRLVDRRRVGAGRRRGKPARRHVIGKAGQRLGQYLARQRQIDRPPGLAGGDGEGAIDNGFELMAVSQLVIPFDQFAHHPGLVEHLLRPVDVDIAGARQPFLGQWRAAGGEQQRHVLARGIEDAAHAVRGADTDMDHDRRDPAGHHRPAMRHRQCQVLVGGEDRAAAPARRCAPLWQRPRPRVRSRCRHWRTDIRPRARRAGSSKPRRRCRPPFPCAPCRFLHEQTICERPT